MNEGGAPPPVLPPMPPTVPGRWARFKAWIRKTSIAAALSSLIVIIASPFLLVSEASIKSYVESFVSGCLFVIEKEQIRPERIRVRGYLYGTPPKYLPITFSAGEVTINRIAMVNEVELNGESTSGSLAFHPQTNRACPGALCEDYGRDASAPKITLKISDLSPEFSYTFDADFDKPLDRNRLTVYVQFDEGLNSGVCRIEEANIFNWYVRQPKWGKFLVLLAVFVTVFVIVATFKKGAEP